MFFSLNLVTRTSKTLTVKVPVYLAARACSSQPVYKIDHSGFVNPLDGDIPKNNDLGVMDNIVNRNPRALEHMNIARRQTGWKFQAPTRNFVNRLILDQSGRIITAYIEHQSGKKVVWASSQEQSLMKRLYSLQDLSAIEAVAQVLARRCLKAGIHHVASTEDPAALKASERLRTFYDVMAANGVALTEPAPILPPERFGIDYDKYDPQAYIDLESAAVDWPVSQEEYDPDKDVMWHNEGIERKHRTMLPTYEQLRPLIDPEPIDYTKLAPLEPVSNSKEGSDKSQKPVLEIKDAIKLIE